MGVEREIEVVTVERQPDFGLLGAGGSLDWARLHEARDRSHFLPDGVIQTAIDHRRARRAERNGPGAGPYRDTAEVGAHEIDRGCRRRHSRGWRARRGRASRGSRRLKPLDHRGGDLVLCREEVAQRAVDLGAVYDTAGVDIDDTSGDAEAITHPLVRTTYEPRDTELTAAFEHSLDRLPKAVCLGRLVECLDEDWLCPDRPTEVPKVGRYRFGDADANPVVLGLSTQVEKRSNGDRRVWRLADVLGTRLCPGERRQEQGENHENRAHP